MRVERRGRGLFLYHCLWNGGRPRKEYHGRIDEAAAEVFRRRQQLVLARLSAERARVRRTAQRAADLLAAGQEFDELVESLFGCVMRLLGFERHHRSEWRPRRGMAMTTARELLRPSKRESIIEVSTDEPELAKILEAGARGDDSILPEARKLLERDNLQKRIGCVAWRAEDRIVEWVAGSNLVVADCVRRQLRADTEKLLKQDGVEPSAAERLIARRASHNATVLHALEVLMVQQPPGSPAAAALAKDLNRAERRLQNSLRTLAILRRLRLPAVRVGQVNVASAVLNNRGKSLKPPNGRTAGSRIESAKALGR